jgi:hypothetical protein
MGDQMEQPKPLTWFEHETRLFKRALKDTDPVFRFGSVVRLIFVLVLGTAPIAFVAWQAGRSVLDPDALTSGGIAVALYAVVFLWHWMVLAPRREHADALTLVGAREEKIRELGDRMQARDVSTADIKGRLIAYRTKLKAANGLSEAAYKSVGNNTMLETWRQEYETWRASVVTMLYEYDIREALEWGTDGPLPQQQPRTNATKQWNGALDRFDPEHARLKALTKAVQDVASPELLRDLATAS